MVCYSDLQPLLLDRVVFGDILMMFPTLLLRPPPLLYSQNGLNRINQVCHQRIENFVRLAQPGAARFFTVGKWGPWRIILTTSEGRETTGIFMPVQKS